MPSQLAKQIRWNAYQIYCCVTSSEKIIVVLCTNKSSMYVQNVVIEPNKIREELPVNTCLCSNFYADKSFQTYTQLMQMNYYPTLMLCN